MVKDVMVRIQEHYIPADFITKKEKEEILARLEAWEKENRTEELELVEEEAK